MWMRGGTSKGGVFLGDDLPADPAARDALLLRIMGSPDPRQIDGMGGGDPLTSKVAIVSRSDAADADIDYLFLQIAVDQAIVSAAQNCGNMLAAVAPFAIERGLVAPAGDETSVAIHMVNSGQRADAVVQTPGGAVTYDGDTAIDGVPGTAAPIALAFRDMAGSACGALLPTGHPRDEIDGVAVTLIDNGMPCVVIAAADVGATGHEPRDLLDAADAVKARVEAIRRAAGPAMGLGDVAQTTVPKMLLVAPPAGAGAIAARSLIPHRVHASIGVFAAITLATACLIPGSVAAPLARVPGGSRKRLAIEHPSGFAECVLDLDDMGGLVRAAIVRTARKLMDGVVYG